MRSGRLAAFWRWRWRWLAVALALCAVHATLATIVWRHARDRLAHPPTQQADAALVLGNRAYLGGQPNPCLTNRVDRGVELARAGQVSALVMSGGEDWEDGRIEAEVMEVHARQSGYTGVVMKESLSSSTRQNLAMSWPLLDAAGVKRVIVVSDPYHLWRIERLARASGFDRAFKVQYAAAPEFCGRRPFLFYKGVLREPLAIINNALSGYLWHDPMEPPLEP
ncbi:YdcF family protein [Variovorax sp. J22R133]|uniref:YdcF family protein n=1 Tax=Variovorax brevis TaxID=3053503 RepID=UPI002574AAB2|nr:YdcF family protein [Variovorax sp. J22R133]MDM0114599.1 YdcF family protein [Variovorax sp. J22R133]